MSKYYWWRRYPKRKKLDPKNAHKLKPFLLQQIEHGDFDESDYGRQAEEEFERRDEELKAFRKFYTGSDPEQDQLYHDIQRKYRKRYNKLMEDYDWDEKNILADFRVALENYFEIDVWDECMEQAFEQDISGAESFYFLYSKLSNKKKKDGNISIN